MTLSDKKFKSKNDDFTESGLFLEEDVKEFIRKVEKRLKKEIDFPSRGLCVPSLQIIKRIITRVLKEEAGKELLE